jgi:hypothetical protein
MFRNSDIIKQMKLMTRQQATEELERRGWTKATDIWPGIWRNADGKTLVWFKALQVEGIKFNPKDKPFNKQ